MLGNIYDDAGQVTQARSHYDVAIRYREQVGDLYRAARTRYNVALMYAQRGEYETALLYAESARRGYLASPNAAADVQQTQQLIAKIQKAMQGGTP